MRKFAGDIPGPKFPKENYADKSEQKFHKMIIQAIFVFFIKKVALVDHTSGLRPEKCDKVRLVFSKFEVFSIFCL